MDKTQEPVISICCFTYNHEGYIRDAIEGFLMQETEFPFEIIIHDDASTDRTADIIREYEEKYPEIIKPIYQIENQYSKGLQEIIQIVLSVYKRSKGKYIALCEGDDYWIDPLKLQKQAVEMEKHPEYHICFHPAIIKWDNGAKKDEILGLHTKKSKVFTVEEVILGGGEFMPTNSIMINKSVIPRISSFFDTIRYVPVADYYTQILGAENGGALYLADMMSVYRTGVSDSWSERFKKSDNSEVDLLMTANNKMDEFTNYRYSRQFALMNRRLISKRLKSVCIDIEIRKNLLKSHNDYINLKDKVIWHTIYKHPRTVEILKRMRDFTFHRSL